MSVAERERNLKIGTDFAISSGRVVDCGSTVASSSLVGHSMGR